jgi:uncharacterized C2H2 Zn-finger protein
MSFTHPRRTTKTTSTALTPTSTSSNASSLLAVNTTMSLRKGATFHQPTTPERELPHNFKVPSLPRRSQSTLDDVVDAHKRRVALTLGNIDRGLAAVEDRSPTTRQSFRDEADPVPQGFLNHTVGTPSTKSYGPIMDGVMSEEPSSSIGKRSLRPRHNRRPSRYSDSGLGSSISSMSGKKAVGAQSNSTSDVAASAITRSAAAHSSTIESLPRLSSRATNRITEHILKPILAKSSLKDFHPIVRDCPRRIHAKEIVCLRDLEKTLIFMAPERTKSAVLYLDFCLTSIRCIQATVEYLSEREQTRPHDRPYTNGYFVDLVDQIKQYAQQVQAAKEKEAKGEALDDMDPESSDEIRLHGGLTKNGQPAELVRVKKNGKAISVATGLPVDIDEDAKDNMRFKRSMSEEAEDDEAILRSMARRKRSASAAELAPKRCREPGCDKEFKRPCDLTKHEKTHSRPWKCPVESCKYHEYGWPTEKEMDRHHNDKHSSAPALYRCKFPPCSYQSKRESNCKQHMEKAHNWTYVRSKNNGKNRDKATASTTGLPTPPTTNIRTPSSEGNNMNTPEEDEDIDMSVYDDSAYYGNQSELTFPEYNSEADIGMFAPQQLHIDYSPITEYTNPPSASGNSPYTSNTLAGQDQFDPNFTTFTNTGGDFNLFDGEDLYNAHVQLPTPSPQMFQQTMGGFETSGMTYGADHPVPHISPLGHGNTMLYTPTSLREVDEGFSDDFVPNNCLGNDFQLFPSSNSGTASSSAPSALFGELPSNINFQHMTGQEMLDFFNHQTAVAAGNINMEWDSDNQYNGYRSQ